MQCLYNMHNIITYILDGAMHATASCECLCFFSLPTHKKPFSMFLLCTLHFFMVRAYSRKCNMKICQWLKHDDANKGRGWKCLCVACDVYTYMYSGKPLRMHLIPHTLYIHHIEKKGKLSELKKQQTKKIHNTSVRNFVYV